MVDAWGEWLLVSASAGWCTLALPCPKLSRAKGAACRVTGTKVVVIPVVREMRGHQHRVIVLLHSFSAAPWAGIRISLQMHKGMLSNAASSVPLASVQCTKRTEV